MQRACREHVMRRSTDMQWFALAMATIPHASLEANPALPVPRHAGPSLHHEGEGPHSDLSIAATSAQVRPQ